jgi:hypothetical protein
VPLNIEAGQHSFSIGLNPLQMSDQTAIFIIPSSETSGVAAPPFSPVTTNTAYQPYNGCGLPPLPNYIYTGYQPPCTVTSDGHVETLYPIVPASDSSVFFGSVPPATTTSLLLTSSTVSLPSFSSPPPPSINTAFATGVYAQALQCPTPVTPSATTLSARGTTTVFSLIACSATSSADTNSGGASGGVCHSSGYKTFSVSGATTSVCCPDGWATTPLVDAQLFCFTSMAQGQGQGQGAAKRVEPLVTISGLAFTSAGVVTAEAAVGSGSLSTQSVATATGLASSSSSSATKSGGVELDFGLLWMSGMVVLIGGLCHVV